MIMGHVLQAGAGQITARQAAVRGGIPMTVPALTVNKVCLSGLDAIALADQLISYGEFDVVVAGGMESMTDAPHLLPDARAGYRLGDGELVDSMMHDGLFCTFDELGMGAATETYTKLKSISRAEQDAFSAASHGRAAAAMKNGVFDEEIVPIPVPQRKGDPVLVTEDEGIRPDTTAESLAKLRPAFSADGTVTAGSSSQISDGACAVVVMSRARAEKLGVPVLAEIGAHARGGRPGPVAAVPAVQRDQEGADREGVSVGQVDLFEINEAFASVAIQSMRDLGIGSDMVNVNGGAIAMGHPIGASGARHRAAPSQRVPPPRRRRPAPRGYAAAAARATPSSSRSRHNEKGGTSHGRHQRAGRTGDRRDPRHRAGHLRAADEPRRQGRGRATPRTTTRPSCSPTSTPTTA